MYIPVSMELILIRFNYYDKRHILPLILNFSELPKRYQENKIVQEIVDSLKNTDGIEKVEIIGGGINEYAELSKVVDDIIGEVNQKVQFVNFYKKDYSDESDIDYEYFGFKNIKYKPAFSFAVKVLSDNSNPDFIGDFSLPIILMD